MNQSALPSDWWSHIKPVQNLLHKEAPAMILFCPYCNQKYEASQGLPASVLTCTHCRQQFEIPEIPAAPAPPIRPALGTFDFGPGGLNRGGYFVIFVVVHLASLFAYLALTGWLKEGLEVDSFLILTDLISILLGLALLIACYYRMKNAAFSSWWSLILLVPLVNWIISLALLVYPPNYGKTRKLDAQGIANLVLLPVLVLGFILVIIVSSKIASANP